MSPFAVTPSYVIFMRRYFIATAVLTGSPTIVYCAALPPPMLVALKHLGYHIQSRVLLLRRLNRPENFCKGRCDGSWLLEWSAKGTKLQVILQCSCFWAFDWDFAISAAYVSIYTFYIGGLSRPSWLIHISHIDKGPDSFYHVAWVVCL